MAPDLPVWQMAQGLLGGLALFLFGLDRTADALKAAVGDRMKTMLARVTANRVTAAIAGAVTTAIIQSSSVTTVLVVGFVTAGLMSVSQSVGVIIGANVGSTMTAQIVAFKVEQTALVMIAAGFAATVITGRDVPKQFGNIVMGLGLIFFGMRLMSDGMAPLRDYPPFMEWMATMESPLPAILVAGTFTALVQSSAATAGIVIAIASGGLISLEAGIALIFGANIGTCVTAVLASAGKSRIALRTAAIHVLFNIGGVLIWLPFIPQLADLVRGLAENGQAAYAAANVPRQIANAHTIFNLANAMIFLPFGNILIWLANLLVPDRPEPESVVPKPKFLDSQLLDTPRMALHAGRQELARMAGIARESFNRTIDGIVNGSGDPYEAVHPALVDLRGLHRAQINYLAHLGRKDLSHEESARLGHQVAVSHNLFRIAEIIEGDLLPAARRVRTWSMSGATAGRGRALAGNVSTALSDLEEALSAPESGRGAAVGEMKPIIDLTIAQSLDAETRWLAGLKESLRDEDIDQMLSEMAVIEAIKRVYSQARRAAREAGTDALDESVSEAT
ncbi:Na/Pi cotransporter family protein [Aliiruegeria lutimaris]|nr:Na/Pi cotransporter family protein [Aliiruegeria lutimaris]